MELCEVIAIAKTLRSGMFLGISSTMYADELHKRELCEICYNNSRRGSFTGITWEDALRSAGWKGYTPKFVDKYTDCGRPKGSPYEGQD